MSGHITCETSYTSLCAKNLIFCPIYGCAVEVLVLIDFESNSDDELTVKEGDVVKNVTKASEEGWLHGELRGKKGIFPANFVQEVPVYLRGQSKMEPRSIRTSKMKKPTRKCEVLFPYSPVNEDEMELVAGETIEIVREIEDGWWMGVKNGKLGAFPSNFVKEIFSSPKAVFVLLNAVFVPIQITQRASVRNKAKKSMECCKVMFDYKAKTEDELELKKGDVVKILNKETADEGWWEGELNGRCGFFPDNFVMVIPPINSLQVSGQKHNLKHNPVGLEFNYDKPEPKDLRSNPPTKVKLPPIIKPSPPPVKDKPNKVLPKTNGDVATVPPKQPEEKETDEFDGLELPTEKLSHPTANRAKPPQRRPPSGLPIAAQTTENLLPTPPKPDLRPKTPPPVRPAPPKVLVDNKTVTFKDEPTVECLQAEIKELRMTLELLEKRQE
uniref:Osteoclast-stimulating factor 1 n=1 Tax=Neolamprologus brichardi TaxID=32507 RepID=A0A3Q4GSJ4_NEOBR